MTRVVVQRGGGPSNPSQRRDATTSASSASSSSSSSVSAPYSPAFPPESASVEDESEHHGYGEPGNLATDPDSRYSTCSSREKDEVGQKENCGLDNLPEGLDRRKEGELGAVLIAAQVAGEGRIEGSGVWGEGEFGRALDLSDEDEGASWASERSGPDCENVECLRLEQILGTELVAGDVSGRAQFQTQHCSQCSGASFHVSSTCPVQQSAQQALAAESLGHATAQHSVPSLQYHLEAGGGGAVAFDKEDVDGGRANSVRNIIESVGCSYVSAPAPAASLSSCSSKSASRRGGWIGPAGSGVRASGPSRRLPRAMKSSRVSPNGSRPSSPRSFGDSDGYNSADEQTAWGSGPAAYEDDGERERQFEIDLRRLKNLEVRRMAEDGNCLFRAVADQVYGDTEMYDDTRQLCIDYMEKERDHFSSFVTESFTAYCKRKRRDKVYGNNLEIQAMAEMYNRPIHIYSYSTEPINIFHGSYETDLPPMRLSYHRSNHYNSLVDPCKPAVGAGLGFSSLRGRNVDREQVKAAIKAQQEQQIDKALLAEGRFYSDLELTEQEIERMVMEASRAEFLAEENHRQQFPGNEETSSSASGMPSSSRTMAIPEGAVTVVVDQFQGLQHTSRAISPSTAASTGSDVQLPSNVRMLLSMGFSYLRVIEAYNIFGDDVNNMLCYLLETETGSVEDRENMCRRKGKATEG